jgi:transcription antitermination factor NusG
MDCQTEDPVWFALRVRSNFERKTGDLLAYKGYPVFSPMYRKSRRDHTGVKESTYPLFPGYIFCSFDPYNRLPVLTTPGIVHIVGIGKSPVPVDSRELNNIRAVVSAGAGVCPRTYLSVGETIRIERGPLAGIEGILEEFRSCYRVVVSVTLLQRSVAAEVNAAWLQPIRRFCPLSPPGLLFDGAAPASPGFEDLD